MKRTFFILPALFFFFPFVSSSQGLYISSGARLITNGAAQIVVQNGNFINNGTFAGSTSTVHFTGSINNALLGGTSTTTFNNLTINKPASNVQLSGNINVVQTLTLINGPVYLNNYNIDLGTTGSLSGESSASAIFGLSTGVVKRTATLNAPVAVNPGNIGITITSAANLGITTINRGNVYQMVSTGHPSIGRYFDIQPTNNTGLNATLVFNYLDAELGVVPEGNLFTWVSPDAGTNWTYTGKTSANTATNIVTKTGFNTLNRITLNVDPVTLPVRSLHLTAKLVNDKAVLSWTTLDEYNNDHFDIERSANAINFSSIGSVNSYGNTAGMQSYGHTDIQPYSGITYYRIRQVDVDGHYSYSNIASVNTSGVPVSFFRVFPNPASELVTIRFYSPEKKDAVLHLYDVTGKLVQAKKISCERGINDVNLDLGKLAAASYILSLENITTQTIRLIKQ